MRSIVIAILAASIGLLGCEPTQEPPQSGAVSSSGAGGGDASSTGATGTGGGGPTAPCDGKGPWELCGGEPGDPVYLICDTENACRFPAWTCKSGHPGDACEGGHCTVPDGACSSAVSCVADSFCCTGCVDDAGRCHPGNDGALCGSRGAPCGACL